MYKSFKNIICYKSSFNIQNLINIALILIVEHRNVKNYFIETLQENLFRY